MRSEAEAAFFSEFAGDPKVFEIPELGELLAAALTEARAPWPDLAIPDADFLRYLGARIDPSAGDAKTALTNLHLSDLYLACGCALRREDAITTFVETHLGDVPKYLARLNLQPALCDEVTQELSQKLLVAAPPDTPRLLTYTGRGALGSFVAIAAQRIALNLLARRSQHAQAPAARDPLETALMTSNDPELMLQKAHLRQDLETAIRQGIARLSSRDRMLLRLSVVGGLSCRKLAEMYGVNFATVSRWLVAVREALLGNVQAYLRDKRGIDPDELTSVLGLARSQIELSLSGVFKTEA